MTFKDYLLGSRYADRLRGIIQHWPEALVGIPSLFRFLLLRVYPKTVLLVEPNAFHGVVLPGYYKYLKDLGFSVVLLCRYANYKNSAFCRCKEKPRLFVVSPTLMRWALRSRKIRQFDFVFFTSSQMFEQSVRAFGEVINYLGAKPQARLGVLHVEHQFLPQQKTYTTDLRDMFVLTKSVSNEVEPPMLNPHWFGDVRHTSLNQGKRIFIAVGNLKYKNNSIPVLFESVRKLEGKYDFEVWLIGAGTKGLEEVGLPRSVKTFGYQTFGKMYELLEHADFILPLLDPDYEGHQHYLEGVTSGAILLSLGFSKIPIMHNRFAERYGFSAQDSILHESGGFEEAMKRALLLDESEYAVIQQQLHELEQSVYSESLENLQKRIEASSSL
jgi:hypothetical protein